MKTDKHSAYQRCREKLEALLETEINTIAKMASVSCVLHNEMDGFFWTGFYRVVDDKLVIGPYQGTLGCLRIDYGRGVCGTAAAQLETQVVPDVHAFPGHIACDSRSQSEIVVPVLDKTGTLLAVLDIDSDQKAHFDKIDQRELELLMAQIFSK